MTASVATLTQLAELCVADISLVRARMASVGAVAEYLVRTRCDGDDFIEVRLPNHIIQKKKKRIHHLLNQVRVAVIGNVDAGKSTLLGVLTHGELDDGRGKCRKHIFRHQHEVATGRTSAIAVDILGFDSRGNIVNTLSHNGIVQWTDICSKAAKVGDCGTPISFKAIS